METELYIGLMSGTSLDGIDCVLVEFADDNCKLLYQLTEAYPIDLRSSLQQLIGSPGQVNVDELGQLNDSVAVAYSAVVRKILAGANIKPESITAIGSHGQTVRHSPDSQPPFSLQLGNPATLAAQTGIITVADFRSADIALGGQGAPLAPAFHQWRFADAAEGRAVVNIGGIANVTLLIPGRPTTGFDTGPGNTLLDGWVERHLGKAFDAAGAWGATGQVDDELLGLMQADPYFARVPPKSTGRETFNLAWLDHLLGQLTGRPSPENVQATLLELTATEIARGVRSAGTEIATIAVCGGGALNQGLMLRLEQLLMECSIQTTDDWGVAPEWVEGVAFAWLARERLAGRAAGVPSVTGASRPAILGGIFSP